MYGRVFQGVLLQMKKATSRLIGVLDGDGRVAACTDPSLVDSEWGEAGAEREQYSAEPTARDGYTYMPLPGWNLQKEITVFAEGGDETAASVCLMAAVALGVAKDAYDEKHDKTTFIKNLLLGTVSPGDIAPRSRELHIEEVVPRVVLLIRLPDGSDAAAADIARNLLPERRGNYAVPLGGTELALVLEQNDFMQQEEVVSFAETLEATLKSELMVRSLIGIGTPAPRLGDVAVSLRDARTALRVGMAFSSGKAVHHYSSLGFGRLIYRLAADDCAVFLSEAFPGASADALDQEMLNTAQSFFENSLSLAETSRKMYLHRNTLVYRLEKIKRLTGLDLQNFEHAVLFKVGLMVRKYLQSGETPR
ncbi:MAG: helix-turn-helix domain-containing protein [Oscillospiraceae bacterium]|jgi:carbohydrate diacid regulator|nr:helix-turn-helix domain-containing protein [Oscillospiraceae bacterium]